MKKYIIIVVCIVTICTVLGTNDRLDYQGVKMAVENVRGNAGIVVDDITSVGVIGWITQNYLPGSELIVTSNGRTLFMRVGESSTMFNFTSRAQAKKVFDYLKPLTRIQSFGDDNISKALTTIVFWISMPFTIILYVFTVLFDSVMVLWGLLESFFYLLGLGSSLSYI